MLTALVVALAVASEATEPPPSELRFVDLQAVVLELPEGRAARDELMAARKKAQAGIDAHRQALADAGPELDEWQRTERAHALEAEASAAERALIEMQDQLLEPIVKRLERLLPDSAVEGRVVVRLDQVPLIGWPKECALTAWLMQRAADDEVVAPKPRTECRARVLRQVDTAALAVAMPEAARAQAEIERFRKVRQAEIDAKLESVQQLERLAEKDPSHQEEATQARAELDAWVMELQTTMADKKRRAEDAVYDQVRTALASAARKLDGVALADRTDAPVPLPVEDGESWAKSVLGLDAPRTSSARDGEPTDAGRSMRLP